MKEITLKNIDFVLPKRTYDITKYASYIDWLNRREREKKFECHCFAVFNPILIKMIEAYLNNNKNCECYKKIITLNELKQYETIR